MKILLSLSFLFVFVSCESGPKGPFFWKAEKEGRVIHILGTIHSGVALEDIKCHQMISSSLDQSSIVWTELQKQKLFQQMMQNQDFQKELVNTSGQDFQNLSPESQNFLRTKFSTKVGGIQNLQKMSYHFLKTMISGTCVHITLELKSLYKMEAQKSLDAEIQNRSQSKNISQSYLDEMGDYIIKAHQVSKEDIEDIVKNYDKNCTKEKFEEATKRIHALSLEAIEQYKSGELSIDFFKIQEERFRQQGFSKEMIRKKLDDYKHYMVKSRNEIWLKKLVSAHQSGNNAKMFVTGGFAHFIGPFNVLDMLEEEGFSVKRFNIDCKVE